MGDAPVLGGLQELLHKSDEPTQLKKLQRRGSAKNFLRAGSFLGSPNARAPATQYQDISLGDAPAPGFIRASSSEGYQAHPSPWLKTERKFEGRAVTSMLCLPTRSVFTSTLLHSPRRNLGRGML